MRRVRYLAMTGAAAAVLTWGATIAAPVQAQVAPPTYGEGPGAGGPVVTAQQLPRTGSAAESDDAAGVLAALGGAAVVLGLCLKVLRGRNPASRG